METVPRPDSNDKWDLPVRVNGCEDITDCVFTVGDDEATVSQNTPDAIGNPQLIVTKKDAE